MPRFVNMDDCDFDKVIVEKFVEASSENNKISWKEGPIKYKYETEILRDGNIEIIEEIAPLIVKYPKLVSDFGLGKFDKEGGGFTYSIAVKLNKDNELHVRIMDFLDGLEAKLKDSIAENFLFLTGKSLQSRIVAMKLDKLPLEDATNCVLETLAYPNLYRHENGLKGNQLTFKLQSNQEGEIYTKFVGIDTLPCDPFSLQQKILTFTPYQKFFRIFHGAFKSMQSKLSEALINDIEVAKMSSSLASKDAEDFMLNNPEESKMYTEKYKLASVVEIKEFQSKKPKNTDESKMADSSKKPSIPLKKDKQEHDLLSFGGDGDDSEEEEEERKPKKKAAKTVQPKKRVRNSDDE